jgi:hypothetical protein
MTFSNRLLVRIFPSSQTPPESFFDDTEQEKGYPDRVI